ncbi:MAG: FN3 domain-containing metallophosphoesterase family protein [Anaerohalosphaeraceae bacterium]
MNSRIIQHIVRMGLLFASLLFWETACALQIVAGPYLQNPSKTSMTIMWMTDSKCTSWVEYGPTQSLGQKAFSSRHGLIDADQTIHRITIDGLPPETAYQYRVCSREILKFKPYKVTYGQTLTGDVYRFKTLSKNKPDFSFIVLNDIHQRDDILAGLIKQSSSKPYDLAFLNGDILSDIEDSSQIIDHVLKPCSELFAKTIPFIYVRGNHETRGKFARMLPEYLAMPNDRFYYAFDHGPVRFIVMDGGEDKTDDNAAYSGLVDFDRYRIQQKQWLQSEIQSNAFKKALFKIVVVHMPPMSSKQWHGSDHLYELWRPLFNEAKIDLLIAGHTHQYAVIPPQTGVCDYPVIIGGKPAEKEATVIRVDVTQDKLDVVMTTDEGKTVGTYQISRKEIES